MGALYYRFYPIDTTRADVISIKTEFEYQEDDTFSDSLYVKVALLIDVEMEPQPVAQVNYGLAWVAREDTTWRYDPPPVLRSFMTDRFLPKLIRELDGIRLKM